MAEHDDNRANPSEPASFLEGVPIFPGEAEDGPTAPLPNRARTWGKTGAICGAIAGGVMGAACVAESLFTGSMDLSKALGLMAVLPILLGLFAGFSWGFRGLMRDLIMQSRDDSAKREAESEKPGDREWAGVK